MLKTASRITKTALFSLLVLFSLWLLLSFADVVTDNNKPDSTHHKTNAFHLLTGEKEVQQ